MQIKLSAQLEKHFAGQSPEQIAASIESLVQSDLDAKAQPKNVISLEQFNALSAKVDGMASGLTVSVAEALKPFEAKLTALDGRITETVTNAKAEASKIASEAISKAGLTAPVGGGNQDANAAPAGNGQAFVDLVKAKCKTMKATEALTAAITENPEAYAAWRGAGCQPSL